LKEKRSSFLFSTNLTMFLQKVLPTRQGKNRLYRYALFYATILFWVAYRDFKDSGPLTSYFPNAVEKPIARQFSGKLRELEKSCKAHGGFPPDIEISYELSMKFNPLPKVPMLLLYNDVDEEFPAHCSLLFEKHADKYLDAESLAILGMILSTYLRKSITSEHVTSD